MIHSETIQTEPAQWKLLSAEDIAIGIFTGARFYNNRAKACKETWLRDFPHHFFYSEVPNRELPVISFAGVGEDYDSCLAKQFKGLKHMWESLPGKSWYFTAGCDTFVYTQRLVDVLKEFDPDDLYLIGGHCGSTELVPNVPAIDYPSGGAGFILSRALMSKLYPFLENALSSWKVRVGMDHPEFFGAADMATAVAAYESCGVQVTAVEGFYGCNPYQGNCCRIDTKKPPVTVHRIEPRLMRRLANNDCQVRFMRNIAFYAAELLSRFRDPRG